MPHDTGDDTIEVVSDVTTLTTGGNGNSTEQKRYPYG